MNRLFLLLSLFILASGCRKSIGPEKLYGTWKYIKVESPQNPQESLTEVEVARENPSISFNPDKKLTIMWGGRELSKGEYRLEGKLIRYKEDLGNGKFREFPFLISRLSASELVFETMEQEPVRITARKETE